MSYDLKLADKNGKTFPMDTPHEGGTMPVGGYYETDFNITYNYSWFYYKCLDSENGLRWLYGRTGQETIDRLEKAIAELGTDKHFEYPRELGLEGWKEENRIYKYWAPTPGNAGAALVPLLEAAKLYPDGVWEGD